MKWGDPQAHQEVETRAVDPTDPDIGCPVVGWISTERQVMRPSKRRSKFIDIACSCTVLMRSKLFLVIAREQRDRGNPGERRSSIAPKASQRFLHKNIVNSSMKNKAPCLQARIF